MKRLQSALVFFQKGYASDFLYSFLAREKDKQNLDYLNNERLNEILEEAVQLMKPANVYIISDEEEEVDLIRKKALELGEEAKLAKEGHTIHFDAYVDSTHHDQARDRNNTFTLVPDGFVARKGLATKDRETGLSDIKEIMDGIMEGKSMFVRFFCLGPKNSKFSKYSLQITDSSYVCHSEDLLYRRAFEQFKDTDDFYYVFHSAGELDSYGNTKNLEKRSIVIDPQGKCVYSANNQYAGNSLGLKKLSLRLAIWDCNNKDWLTEHMFISGYEHYNGDVAYFAGAYPSACGKTSTAMIEGSKIVGDDISYFRNIDGKMHGVNIEVGCFGIIKGVNAEDDPVIYEVLKGLDNTAEVIFSNVLEKDGEVYWDGMEEETPDEGYNFSHEWYKGKLGTDGKEIPISHGNARFTVAMENLRGCDVEGLHDVNGVHIKGILYGGRDSDTVLPVLETFDWNHGVFVGAGIESEDTIAVVNATKGKKPSPFANMDFMITPMKDYLANHYRFGDLLEDVPKVFSTNYFLCDKEGIPLTNKTYNKLWVKWAVGRVLGEEAWGVETPLGYIPTYDSLVEIIGREYPDRKYTKEEYISQFTIRAKKYQEKFERIEEFFNVGDKKEQKMPDQFYEVLNAQKEGIKKLISKYGDEVSPFEFQ